MRRKNGTVWAHEGYLHPHNWNWAIPTPQVGSGQRTGWPYFVKSPLALTGRGGPPIEWFFINNSFRGLLLHEWSGSLEGSILNVYRIDTNIYVLFIQLRYLVVPRWVFTKHRCSVYFQTSSTVRLRLLSSPDAILMLQVGASRLKSDWDCSIIAIFGEMIPNV